jgi:hypothetical protein
VDLQCVECALAAVARSRPTAVADLPALAVSCIDVLASLTPDLAALVKVIGTKAFLGITLDLHLVLQTSDLFSDEVLRDAQGNVTIIRPACSAAFCQVVQSRFRVAGLPYRVL